MSFSKTLSPNFSLVVPCFNEEEAIPFVLQELQSLMQDFAFEVIVVDDGSSDSSVELVQKFDRIRSIQHKENQGYGAAIKTGIIAAKTDYVAIMDLDGTCDPRDLRKLLSFMRQNPACAFVVGNRLHKFSSMPRIRQLGNSLFSLLSSMLFLRIIKDPCSGIRIYKKSWLTYFFDELPNALNFSLATTLLVAANKHQIAEIDVVYKHRIGCSKLCEIKDGLSFLKTILSYRFFSKSNRSISWNNSTDQIA